MYVYASRAVSTRAGLVFNELRIYSGTSEIFFQMFYLLNYLAARQRNIAVSFDKNIARIDHIYPKENRKKSISFKVLKF